MTLKKHLNNTIRKVAARSVIHFRKMNHEDIKFFQQVYLLATDRQPFETGTWSVFRLTAEFAYIDNELTWVFSVDRETQVNWDPTHPSFFHTGEKEFNRHMNQKITPEEVDYLPHEVERFIDLVLAHL